MYKNWLVIWHSKENERYGNILHTASHFGITEEELKTRLWFFPEKEYVIYFEIELKGGTMLNP